LLVSAIRWNNKSLCIISLLVHKCFSHRYILTKSAIIAIKSYSKIRIYLLSQLKHTLIYVSSTFHLENIVIRSKRYCYFGIYSVKVHIIRTLKLLAIEVKHASIWIIVIDLELCCIEKLADSQGRVIFEIKGIISQQRIKGTLQENVEETLD